MAQIFRSDKELIMEDRVRFDQKTNNQEIANSEKPNFVPIECNNIVSVSSKIDLLTAQALQLQQAEKVSELDERELEADTETKKTGAFLLL